MNPSPSALVRERPPKTFAAVPELRRRRAHSWPEMSETRQRGWRAGECDKSLTKEGLAWGGVRATTARVMTTTRKPETTMGGGMTHDGALFRRLENFFRARRAELRAEKLSDSA